MSAKKIYISKLVSDSVDIDGFFFRGEFTVTRNGQRGFFGLYREGCKIMLYARLYGSVLPCADFRVTRNQTFNEILDYLKSL